jgi:hypothetical protein
VLLEEGKDYSLVRFVTRYCSPSHECSTYLPHRRDQKYSPDDSTHEATPWWAPLGHLPPSHPRVPRLFKPSSENMASDVSPWWNSLLSPTKSKKSKSRADKAEFRSRPHPEVGSTTWKKYMEPVGYPAHSMYEHDTRATDHVGTRLALPWHSPEYALEYLSPVGYYPSPSIYSIPYASPVLSQRSYMLASPMGHFSDHSEHLVGDDGYEPQIYPYAPV